MTSVLRSTQADRGPRLLSIGQVLALLQPEFPELTPSKLRFLEEQRLVSPARTPSGYRKFSSSDIERIIRVLSMQRDQYLPLKVIRAHLDTVDAGEIPERLGAATSDSFLATARRYHRDNLLETAGATRELFDEAISARLLPIAEHYGDDSLRILSALVAVRRVGIEPRHLRGLRAAAEREAALIEQALAPFRRSDAADSARMTESALELAGHLEAIRSAVVRETVAGSPR